MTPGRGGCAARSIMVQGTASSVGKSLIAAALCRLFARRGLRVAPFKAQNMSNNAAALAGGFEIGRAQQLQAMAARAEPRPEMNPILLKPEGDDRSQVVLMGRPYGTFEAREYYALKPLLWETVLGALGTLKAEAELIVVEGAGSPAEINLYGHDIVNMAVARELDAPVILVADIDPGGVFAQVVGTLALLPEEDRARVRGVVINKFRGDPSLLEPGLRELEARTGVPVLGVVPMLSGLELPDEDGAGIAGGGPGRGGACGPGGRAEAGPEPGGRPPRPLDLAILRLPHIANFDDFDPLAAEPAVSLRFVDEPAQLGRPDVLVLPGTKATLADLAWLKSRGFDDGIRWLARTGTQVVGICGGFQMLGARIEDPGGVEGGGAAEGLGLLPASTVFRCSKQVSPGRGRTAASLGGRLACLSGIEIGGYEIHSGETRVEGPAFAELRSESGTGPDGAWSPDGAVWGTYLHGIFGSDGFRRTWLSSFGAEARREARAAALDESIDALADAVAAAIDLGRLDAIIGLDGNPSRPEGS